MPKRNRLVAVSNRLPVVLSREQDEWHSKPGSGGLIAALAPVLRNRGGLWIGWPGTTIRTEDRRDSDTRAISDYPGIENSLREATIKVGYDLQAVMLTPEEIEGFYFGFANEILWPLFHGLETRCNFNPTYWHHYSAVNHRFAQAVVQRSREHDFIWIHDYHLMLVASELRRMGFKQRLGFFLHIPFPPTDIFFKLPWRAEIIRGLLAFDLVGFQTMRDRRNFTNCLQQLHLPGLTLSGRGAVINISLNKHDIRAGAFPISIDYDSLASLADRKETADEAWLFHEQFPEHQVIIGMDRLDYTKGIPERLEAFRWTLKKYPELHNKVSLVQVTVPSREKVPEYEQLRGHIEQLVGEINGEFAKAGGWVPVHYVHRSYSRAEVCAMLRAAEIALVTPLRDGMNLVAKEYCACQVDHRGVLILSEFAGAAAEFKRGALLVNPYDVEGMADAIYRAFHMKQDERTRRMKKLREQVRRHNIFHWVDDVLRSAFARQLADFPVVEERAPRI